MKTIIWHYIFPNPNEVPSRNPKFLVFSCQSQSHLARWNSDKTLLFFLCRSLCCAGSQPLVDFISKLMLASVAHRCHCRERKTGTIVRLSKACINITSIWFFSAKTWKSTGFHRQPSRKSGKVSFCFFIKIKKLLDIECYNYILKTSVLLHTARAAKLQHSEAGVRFHL